MKKIYSFLLTAVAVLSLIPFAKADEGDETTTPQKGPDYYLNDDGSIGYMKRISEPNTDGVYTITLESFATGKSVKINKSVAADIVLVLDMSGSMAWDMAGNQTQVVANRRVTAMKDAVKAFIEQIDINDEYEKYVAEGSSENVKRSKRLGNSIAIVTFNSNVTTVAGLTKVETGKAALITAVDNLNDNPTGGTRSDLGMERAYSILSPLKDNDEHQLLTTVMFTDGDPGGGSEWDPSTTNDDEVFESVYTGRSRRNWYSDWSYTTATVLTGYSANAPGYSTNTHNGEFTWQTANKAIGFANDIKNLANADLEIKSSVYSVSIITNPSIYTDVYLGKLSSNYKVGTTMMAELPEVVEVTQWQWNSSNPQTTRIRHALTWDASNPWGNGNGVALPASEQKYTFTATDREKLKEVFETIAGESGGGSQDLGEQAVTEVDVVSASFTMPPGTNTSDIKIYIEECLGREEKTYIDDDENEQTKVFLKFGNRAGPINPAGGVYSGFYYDKVTQNEDGTTTTEHVRVDQNIRVVFGQSGTDPNNAEKEDVIEIKGFDYGGNWCGPVYKEGVPEDTKMEDATDDQIADWNGYKVIVEIPIMMDPNAVGGADAPTNAEGSGIIVNGTNVAPFISPQVSLPINIHIRKEGLKEGESAKFLIERKLLTDPETAWVEVSNVFVTRHKGQAETGNNAPVTKIVGMPSVDDQDREFVYRVVEGNWNWSGELQAIKGPDGGAIGNTATRSALSTELITNPFIFVNKEKDGIDYKVRHAESKATNTFKTGLEKNVEFDDSKNNGRDVITVTTTGSTTPAEE